MFVWVCVLSTVRFENFKGGDQLINTETIFKLVKLEFKRTTQMRGSYKTFAGVPVTAEEWAQDLLSHITVKASSICSPWLHMGRLPTQQAALAALCSLNKATKTMLSPMAGTRRKSNNPSTPDKITTHGEDVERIAKMVGNAQSELTG